MHAPCGTNDAAAATAGAKDGTSGGVGMEGGTGTATGGGAVVLSVRGAQRKMALHSAPDGVVLFTDVHLDVRRGVVVTGPSGCGKSLLLRIIARLDGNDGGAIAQATSMRLYGRLSNTVRYAFLCFLAGATNHT